MSFSDGLKKLKRLFGAESSEGLQEQLASLRLAVEQGEDTIRSLHAEIQATREELRAARQELAAEKAARQAAEVALADERGAVVALKEAVARPAPRTGPPGHGQHQQLEAAVFRLSEEAWKERRRQARSKEPQEEERPQARCPEGTQGGRLPAA